MHTSSPLKWGLSITYILLAAHILHAMLNPDLNKVFTRTAEPLAHRRPEAELRMNLSHDQPAAPLKAAHTVRQNPPAGHHKVPQALAPLDTQMTTPKAPGHGAAAGLIIPAAQGLAPGALGRRLPAIHYLQRAAQEQAPGYPQHCAERWQGLGFIEDRLRKTMQPVCWPKDKSPQGSMLLCSFQFDETYHDKGIHESYCFGSNLALDLLKLQAAFNASPEVQTLVGGSQQYKPRSYDSPGAVVGNCAMQPRGRAEALSGEIPELLQYHPTLARFNLTNKGKGFNEATFDISPAGAKWLYYNFMPAGHRGPPPPKCIAYIDHPVYFVAERWEPHNVWHGLEDISHAFEVYAMMGWGEDTQVVVIDAPDNEHMWEHVAYADVWRRVLSPVHEPTSLKGLVHRTLVAHKGKLPTGAALCLRGGSSWNVNGGISILSRGNGWRSPCTNSTTFNALANFILDRLDLLGVRPCSHEATNSSNGGSIDGGAPLNVVWAWRTSRVDRQDEVVVLLEKKLGAAGVQLSKVNFGQLAMTEQLRTVRGADVLIGYHGAALTLSMFMTGEGALVEIQKQGEYRCHCYTNAAVWRDRPYYLLSSDETPGFPKAVLDTVLEAAGLVRRRIAASRAGVPFRDAPKNAFQQQVSNEPQGRIWASEEEGEEVEVGGGPGGLVTRQPKGLEWG